MRLKIKLFANSTLHNGIKRARNCAKTIFRIVEMVFSKLEIISGKLEMVFTHPKVNLPNMDVLKKMGKINPVFLIYYHYLSKITDFRTKWQKPSAAFIAYIHQNNPIIAVFFAQKAAANFTPKFNTI